MNFWIKFGFGLDEESISVCSGLDSAGSWVIELDPEYGNAHVNSRTLNGFMHIVFLTCFLNFRAMNKKITCWSSRNELSTVTL